jgi:hypothetical protein
LLNVSCRYANIDAMTFFFTKMQRSNQWGRKRNSQGVGKSRGKCHQNYWKHQERKWNEGGCVTKKKQNTKLMYKDNKHKEYQQQPMTKFLNGFNCMHHKNIIHKELNSYTYIRFKIRKFKILDMLVSMAQSSDFAQLASTSIWIVY